MIKRNCTFPTLLIVLLLFTIVCCKNEQKESVKSAENSLTDNIANKKIDSNSNKKVVTEATLLNPNFDNSKIHGIGIFKIGSTVDSTIKKLLANGYKLQILNNYNQQSDYELYGSQKGKIVAQVSPINPLKTDQRMIILNTPGIWCKKTNVFLINTYKIDNLNLKKLVVTFYDNRLVSLFTAYDQNLENAIEGKYGKPDNDIAVENRYFSKIWKNQDLEIESLPEMYFKVWVEGSYHFIKTCSDKDFETQSDLEKSKLKSGVPNL
jgi:hypothetical protein